MKKYLIPGFLAVTVLFTGMLSSCKKYADPPPFFEDDLDTTNTITSRRVLLIGIDGAVSSEVKTIAPPTITGMLAHAKFQWDGVTDEISTDAASWKTLVSGVSYGRHKIKDSTFIYTPPEGEDSHGGAPSYYPSMFSYILSSANKNNLRTSFISSWPTLVERVVPEVLDPVIATGDQGVKDSAIARLKNKNPEYMVLHFNSPSIAGKSGGFTSSNTGYKDAITKVDSYIGEIMTALKARPEYNKNEEWLVIITNTHGGVGNNYGGGTSKENTSLVMFYNEKFKQGEFRRADHSIVEIKGRDGNTVKAQALDDNGLYSVGNGEQTIQFKMKGTGFGNYPHWVSTMSRWPSTSGWSIFSGGGNWSISVRSTTSGERRIQGAPTGPYADGNWHTLTVVFYDSAGSRWVKRFTDDMRIKESANVNLGASWGDIANSGPLTFGWGADPGYNPVTYGLSDVRIFNTALTDAEIVSSLCLKDILADHPKKNNIIGYWPCNDAFGGKFSNYAAGKSNYPLTLAGPFSWITEPLLPCSFTAAPADPSKTQLLITSSSMARTIFYWIRVPVADSWGFEGVDWLKNYDEEFVEF
ncbi:alkaline phosphatase family protein [Niabella insulamsoli]|uniref:alkaline phosphatase family protein n=1 Tax=Niabella insulamsoli TaxID=3144874 RepID=UPI0031FD4D6E